MNNYRYSALDQQGHKLSGTIAAQGLSEARAHLRAQAFYIFEIRQAPHYLNPLSVLALL